MVQQSYDAEAVTALARETALKVGCQAVRWWHDKGDPHHVYIDATPTFLSGQSFSVLLEIILPELQTWGRQDQRTAKQSAFS
jgi:hypothetical protein